MTSAPPPGNRMAPLPALGSFDEALTGPNLLVFDGAMGTMLYSKGAFIHRAFEEMNLRKPEEVRAIHAAYVAAGARVLETNTFAANRFRLSPHGLAAEVETINRRAVELARDAAGGKAWVAGAIGPLGARIEPFGSIARREAHEVFVEQARALADAGVDLFVLETFAHLPEIEIAIAAVREVSRAPIVAQVSVATGAVTREGVPAGEAAARMEQAGATAVGVNCSEALATLEALEAMRKGTKVPLIGQPNAGQPRSVEGRTLYLASPDYLVAWARRAQALGARLLGGCCGTTPEHIRALLSIVPTTAPSTVGSIDRDRTNVPEVSTSGAAEPSKLAGWLEAGKFVFGVELTPPPGWSTEATVELATELGTGEGRFVAIAEGGSAPARISSVVLGQLCQARGIESLVHYACRGRPLVRMQSHWLGAYATGVRNLLVLTGDPLHPGAEPDSPPDLEVDSVGAVHLASCLNRGQDLAGNAIGAPTALRVAVRLDPTASDRERERERFLAKRAAGAEWAVTVPIFDPASLEAMLEALGENVTPVIATLWPLTSAREAEFFEHRLANVPVPAPVLERMRAAETRGDEVEEGLRIAVEIATQLRPKVQGFLVAMPEGRADVVRRLVAALAP